MILDSLTPQLNHHGNPTIKPYGATQAAHAVRRGAVRSILTLCYAYGSLCHGAERGALGDIGGDGGVSNAREGVAMSDGEGDGCGHIWWQG